MAEISGHLNIHLFFSSLFLLGLISTAILTPIVISLARKFKAVDTDPYRKGTRVDIPLLGGLGIAIPLLAICILFSRLNIFHQQHPGWLFHVGLFLRNTARLHSGKGGEFSRSLIIFSIGGIAIIGLGILDDLRGLRARGKFLGQIIIAVFVCGCGPIIRGIYIPLVGGVPLGPAASLGLSILWIVGLINAFNLIDGLDGLAAGVGLIASVTLIVLGAITGNTITVFVCPILAGSLLAFLAFNFPPARIFLGDTGSMFIGYTLAVVTLIGTFTYKSETAVILLAPIIALSFPIYETVISMIRRFVHGVPIFSGDQLHTHHRLIDKGLSHRQVVLLLYFVTVLLASAAIISQVIPRGGKGEWLPIMIVGITIIGIAWWAGYLRLESLRMIFHRRRRNTILQAFTTYAVQSLAANTPAIDLHDMMELCRRELGLSFLDAWFESGPILIGSSGTLPPAREESNRLDSSDRLRVRSISGLQIVIRYQFNHHPGEDERRIVSACLEAIFRQAGGSLLLKKAIALQKKIADNRSLRPVSLPDLRIENVKNLH